MHRFAPIFPDTCYHLTHYKPAAVDIPVASDNPVHYADAIRYNARTPSSSFAAVNPSGLGMTDVVTLYRFTDLLCRYSPDSAPPCSSVQAPTSGKLPCFITPGSLNHIYPSPPLETPEVVAEAAFHCPSMTSCTVSLLKPPV